MTTPHRHRFALALLAVLATAACGAEPGSDPVEDTSEATASASATESASPEPEELTAADGTDYAACDDGSCEVLVSGEVEFAFDDYTLTVTISADGIETHTASSDNTRSGSSSMSGPGISEAYCVAYLTAAGNTMQCYPDTEPDEAPAPEAEAGVLVLEMLDFLDGTAVIRMSLD
jgi:hypothetical protein